MTKIILKGPSSLLKPTITQILAEYQLLENLKPPQVYGIPIPEYQASVKFKPHVELFFSQDRLDMLPEDNLGRGEISFRLMNETSESLTIPKIQALAQKIRTKFGGDAPFTWTKGKTYYSYIDKAKGYHFQLLTNGEPEARRIIESTMDIQGHSPEWERLGISGKALPNQVFPPTSERIIILGKSRKLPQRRPVVTVKFRHASLIVWGLVNPIHLVGYGKSVEIPTF